MAIQPEGPKEGKLRPQPSAAPALGPAALDLTPKFPGQLSSDLEGGAAFAPPVECSHHGGNSPTLSPGWVAKVNELVVVKCFEILG